MAGVSSNKTIAKNTLFLYSRMILSMAISLYTSRVNLSVLGVEDNGIYQVVGGVVVMFSFLNGSLSGATSRFLTYELGRNDFNRLRKTFASALTVHVLVAVIVVICAETIGLWVLNNKLVIPENRMHVAQIVYQFSVISCAIGIIQVPYNASIISHEKMNVYAYMSILGVTMTLAICYLLYITPFDKLLSFGVMVFLSGVLKQWIYHHYCSKHFAECRFTLTRDSKIIKPIMSFACWDLLGNFSVMARTTGSSLVLNTFFGPVINAACGFASTVGSSILGFSNNFLTAIRPPIVKAYSARDYEKMEELMINASKYGFSLLLFFSVPYIFESQFVLDMWLKTPPKYTSEFSILELLLSLFSSMFLPLMYAIHATGNIRFMSLVNGSIWLLVVPVTYVFLRLGFDPVVPYFVKLFLLFFVVTSNMYNVKRLIPAFNVHLYLQKAVLPSFTLGVVVFIITYFAHIAYTDSETIQFLITGSTSTIVISFCAYKFMFTDSQRAVVKSKIGRFFKR